MTKLTEKILLFRIRSNQDAEAFAELYDRYVERIYRFVFFKTSHRQEAEDITSDVFLKTWDYLIEEKNRYIRSFSGLIYSIARNKVVDWYRERAKIKEYTIDEAITEFAGENPETTLQIKEDSQELFKAIRLLKREYQEVLLLRFVEELSIADIAEIVGKKRTATRVTLHRATKKLEELQNKK